MLAGREWLAGSFSVADILMADVLRLVDRFDGLADHPACRDYVARATARPAFVKARADQMAHFAAADRGALDQLASVRQAWSERRTPVMRQTRPIVISATENRQ